MAGQSYRELIVWQKAMLLVTEVYNSTRSFPREELFGLTSQLRRAVISIPSNIAEGQGRNSAKEFVYHLSIAYGSLMETETQLQIGANLGYLQNSELERLLDRSAEDGRLLNGLSRSIKQTN